MKALVELFLSGGPVMFFIAVISLAAWYLAMRAWVVAGSLRREFEKINVPLLQTPLNHYKRARPAQHVSQWPGDYGDYQSICFCVESQTARLKRTLWLIGTLAAVLPLLGLLGTVLGMLISFEVIQVHGTSQPRLLAGGIGQALMTTQAGLWTAVPVLFFHHIISSRVRLISNEMEVLSHVMQTRFANIKPAGPTNGRTAQMPDHHANHTGGR
jgi:biopolymer transport protein ExbB/TolQ